MARQHNFSAGPGVLPESVISKAREALWELGDTGLGLVESSHRSKAFDAIVTQAAERLHRLLGCDDDQVVLFLHGGARTQFHQVPMNLLRGSRAAYLDTGTWSKGAIEEAKLFGEVDVPWSSRERGYDSVPAAGDYAVPEGVRYLHYTSNNTVAGSEFDHIPDPGAAWLMCDASSNFLSRPVDARRFDLLYAGAQKNLGPSGVTIVVIRRSLLPHCDTAIPRMERYGVHVEKASMFNTPCTFAIYVVNEVLGWIEDQGGLAVVDARNQAQADAVYAEIDRTGFWKGRVQRASRSRMNVTFSTGDADLDALFVKEATAAGLHGLKGHRSVGGLRASLYNAQTDAAVEALVGFLRAFEAARG
jgi:phosphoserine aminotransferase